MNSALRPRDIQARIRSGESPETVAAAAQTTLEAIMAYATPVLAERAHIARTAQTSSIRRGSAEPRASARTLGDAATRYLSEHSLHERDLEWDAWRRADGRWMLVAEYATEGNPRRAEFTYDLPGRYVVAENDDARRLTGELAETRPGDKAATKSPPAGSGRRLSAVRQQDELPLGDDAIELVREDPADHGPNEPNQTDEPSETDDGDGEQTAEVPLAPAPAADRTDRQPSRSPAAATKKKGRPSVPSWDEIMFGGGQSE